MIYGASSSNYMNSIGSFYKYNYADMKSAGSQGGNAALKELGINNGYINRDAAKYVASIRINARHMFESLKSVTDASTFNKMQAVSSNEDYLKVEDNGDKPSAIKETSVDVTQTAAAQTNEGAAMKSDDKYVSSGKRQFEIEIGGKKHQFSIDVISGDTNRSIQQKMANAINSKNIGVTASVNADSKNNTSALVVSAKETGSKNEFSVRDVEGSLASATGINSGTSAARDAIYRINGGEARSSASNRIELDNGVAVTLIKPTDRSVTISAERDAGFAQNAVKDMVDVYNGLLTAAGTSSSRLKNDLSNAFKAYSPSLERLGISRSGDGTLSVDEGRLKAASKNGDLERFFTGSINGNSYGFTGRLSQVSRNAEYNTSVYLNSPSNTASTPLSMPYSYRQGANGYEFFQSNMSGTYNNITGYLFDLYA